MDNDVLVPAESFYGAWNVKYRPFGPASSAIQPMITEVCAHGADGCCAIELPEDKDGPRTIVVRRELYLQERGDELVVVSGAAYERYLVPTVGEARALLETQPYMSALLVFQVPRRGAIQFIHGRIYDESLLNMRRFGVQVDEALEAARKHVAHHHLRTAP